VSVTHNEKAARFRALDDSTGAFVIPSPWDVGSARILAGLDFQALATSSAASASAVGRRDGGLTRDEAATAGVRRISLATSFYRAAMTGLLDAAGEVKDTGHFGFLDWCVTTPEAGQTHADLMALWTTMSTRTVSRLYVSSARFTALGPRVGPSARSHSFCFWHPCLENRRHRAHSHLSYRACQPRHVSQA
jgi:2-methylisocitrate lyase-like PEP mutase family enzyme